MEKKSLMHRIFHALAWLIVNIDKVAFSYLKKRLFKRRLNRAKTEALNRQAQTGRKQFVIVMKSKPVVVSKANLQILIRRRYFRKGTTIQDIEKRALFVTETFSKRKAGGLTYGRTMNRYKQEAW